MKKICKSHVVLPCLVSECPQCQQIIKKLNKQEGTFIQDKIKPFIHNYAKLFCNETILKAVMGKQFPTCKEVETVREKKRTCKCCKSSSGRLNNGSDIDIRNSIWSLVETDVSSARYENKHVPNEKFPDEQNRKEKNRTSCSSNNEHNAKAALANRAELSEPIEETNNNLVQKIESLSKNNDDNSESNERDVDKVLYSFRANETQRQETVSDLSLNEQLMLSSTSEHTSTSMVKLWPKSTGRVISSEDNLDISKTGGLNYEAQYNSQESGAMKEVEKIRFTTTGREDEKFRASLRSDSKNHGERNINPHTRDFNRTEYNLDDQNFHPERQRLPLKFLDAGFKEPPPLYVKYVERNINSNRELDITKTNSFPTNNGYNTLHHDWNNSIMRNPKYMHDYNYNEPRNYIPVSHGVGWKNFNYKPNYQPERRYLSPGPTHYQNQLRYFSSGNTYETYTSTMNSGFKRTVSPLLSHDRTKDPNFQNVKFNCILNERSSNKDGYSPLYRRMFLDTSVTNNNTIGQRNDPDMNWRYLPTTEHSNLFNSIATGEKETINPEFLTRNLPKVQYSIPVNPKTISRYLKLKTKKFKSAVQPYNLELLRVRSIQRKSVEQTSNISHILRKYVGSENMHIYQKQKAAAEVERYKKEIKPSFDRKDNLMDTCVKGKNFTCRKYICSYNIDSQKYNSNRMMLASTKDDLMPCQKRPIDKREHGKNQKANATIKDEKNVEKNGQQETWEKYLEVIHKNKVNQFKIERVPQPLEPLLSKIIHLETLYDVNVPKAKTQYNHIKNMKNLIY